MVYDAARRAARFARAKGACDDIVARALRAGADAKFIQGEAMCRLADEYDAAQERGEVGQRTGRPKVVPDENDITPAAADLGLSRKEIHEARKLREHPAPKRRAALDNIVARGDDPTGANLRREAAGIAADWFGPSHALLAQSLAKFEELPPSAG